MNKGVQQKLSRAERKFPTAAEQKETTERARSAVAGGGEARPRSGLIILRERNRGGGKVGNLLLVFHFPIRLRRRSCGNVGISPFFGEISKVLVGRVGSLLLAFHSFHSPDISAALFFGLRLRGYLCNGARLWLAIVGRGPFSSCCSLVGSSLHSSPGYEHGGSSGPATRRSAALSPVPQSIRQTVDCW
jgi:hypothetical protein